MFPPPDTLQQKATGGMFGQSPMLGGGAGGNVLGTGLFNQANATGGGGGGIFGNKPQTSSGLQLGQTSGGLQLGQSTGGLQLGQSTGGLQLGQSSGLQLGQTAGLGGLQAGGGVFGKMYLTLVSKGFDITLYLIKGGGGALGGAGAQGTAVAKYEPCKASDTLNKNGVTVNVHTLLHCITASNSYMQKSMEVSTSLPLPLY